MGFSGDLPDVNMLNVSVFVGFTTRTVSPFLHSSWKSRSQSKTEVEPSSYGFSEVAATWELIIGRGNVWKTGELGLDSDEKHHFEERF